MATTIAEANAFKLNQNDQMTPKLDEKMKTQKTK